MSGTGSLFSSPVPLIYSFCLLMHYYPSLTLSYTSLGCLVYMLFIRVIGLHMSISVSSLPILVLYTIDFLVLEAVGDSAVVFLP